MWKSHPYCQDQTNSRPLKSKNAFILTEILIFLSTCLILVGVLLSILRLTIRAQKKGEVVDSIIINGQYAMEYIKREIKQAEKIIHINQFEGMKRKYPGNIGFVIMRYYPNSSNNMPRYNYSIYYLKSNKLYRDAANRYDPGLPNSTSFSGNNVLLENIRSLEESGIDLDNRLLRLEFLLCDEDEEIRLSTQLSVRCPIIH